PLQEAAARFDRWPVPRSSAGDDAAQFAAVTLAEDAADGRVYLGLTRHVVTAPDRLAVMDLNPTLAALWRRHREAGRPMRMAVAVGADPALILAAAIGTWRKAALNLAGALGGVPVRLMRDALLPAEAELVVRGMLSLEATARPGRLASLFGTHQDGDAWPVFQAERVLVRRDPVLHVMQAGAAGDLAEALALAAEALVLEHIRNIEGGLDIIDLRCPAVAAAQVVVVKLRPRLEGQAKTALMGALSGPVNTLKLAVAVDEDVDAGDLRDVFWSIASRTHAATDVGLIRGLRAHPLDFAAVPAGTDGARIGTRWFIDATMPPLTQGKRREDFARAIPKNLASVELRRFLPWTEKDA
ncbi:MAG: UbiD family decarboxylase domain-containing protein, partial [Stellaceae bacterium]